MLLKKDKIFIAGHRGMAGRSICKALNEKGYKNLVLKNRNELDLQDFIAVENFFDKNKPDVVVIAAATVGGIKSNNNNPVNFILNNLKIQNNIIEMAWKYKTRRLLFLGSSCIYPKNSIQPIKEEYLLTGKLEETNQWYAIAKIAGMKLCEALRKQYGFDAISVMPTNLYGPGDNFNLDNSHVLPALLRKFYEAKLYSKKEVLCWGSGKPRREFMYVDEFGKACVYVLENFHPQLQNNEIPFLNIGTGVAQKIADLIDFKGNIIWDIKEPDGTFQKKLNVDKLNQLGWKSEVSIDEGLSKTMEYFIKSYKSKDVRL